MTHNHPLNVVRVISFMNVGGVQRMLLKTLPYIDRSRFNMRVCATTRNGEIGRELQRQGIPVDVVRVRGRMNPIDLFRLARWLKASKADIVHTHQYASNITGVLAARLAGVPVIVSHIHATHEWRVRSRAFVDRFNDRFRAGYLAVSEAVRDAFLDATGLGCKDKIRVLYNVVDSAPVSPGDPAIREKWGIPPDAPVVGTVARMVPVKAIDVLIRSAKLVVARRPEVRFVIVGKGKLLDELIGHAAELGIGENVVFTGEQLNIADYYGMFDMFALSSRSEGLGNVLLEAMRYGNPIVATRVGGVPELVRDGETGILVEPESPKALADGIEKLLADRELARSLAANASGFVRQFSRESYVETLQNYYEELYEKVRCQKGCE
ncbi:glycosyltransferase [bacterium]|nr:glycosyltransferase [bacterium]